jgi:hypothetical protein
MPILCKLRLHKWRAFLPQPVHQLDGELAWFRGKQCRRCWAIRGGFTLGIVYPERLHLELDRLDEVAKRLAPR